MALATYPIVFGVQNPFDRVLGDTVDGEWRWGRLFAVVECVGVFGLQLGDVEYRVNSYRTGEAESEGSGRRLGNDRKWADLFLREFAGGSVRANMFSTDIYAVTNAKGRRFHAVSVRVLDYGGLGVLHMIAQALVVLVEVDGEVTRS